MTEPMGKVFGETLKAWFKSNGWPQGITETVAKAKGSKTGPWASQISHAMNGKHEPKVPFFMALAWFNRVVMERDIVDIKDRRTIDRLKNAEPMLHEDGQPWEAHDFFRLYAGTLEPPKDLVRGAEELTQEALDIWVEGLRGGFQEACRACMSPPAATWQIIQDKCTEDFDCNLDDLHYSRDCIAGIRIPTLQEASRMRAKYPNHPLIRAMILLIEDCGGDSSEAKELLGYIETKKPRNADIMQTSPLV